MNVLHVIPSISPRHGGPTSVVLATCRALHRQGVNAVIATTNDNCTGKFDVPLEAVSHVEGVPVYFFNRQISRRYTFSWPLTRWLKHHVAMFDVLHIHALFSYSTTPAAFYARRRSVPYIIRPLGTLDVRPLKKSAFRKRLYLRLIENRNLDGATLIHYTSSEEQRQAKRLGLRKLGVVIPNPVAVKEKIEGMPERGEFRRRYGITSKHLVLFLSRLDPDKGLDLLIPSFKQVLNSGHDVVLVIAGSGEESYYQKLKSFVAKEGIGEKVVFTGMLLGEVKRAAFSDTDIFVLTSYHESFGVAVAEAMSFGLPILISNQVGIHDYVTSYQAGVVTPCKIEAIATAFNQLLDNEAMRVRMGASGRRLVREKFSPDVVARQLVKVYKCVKEAALHKVI